MIISITVCVIILLLTAFIVAGWTRLSAYNQKPLDIQTFDGFKSPYHPSVLFFDKGWNGWRYWMAETPFSPKSQPYRDRNECPSIHVSNDGLNWTEPTGLRNPLVDLDSSSINNRDYFSDPHLVFRDNKLECWFRLTRRHGDYSDFTDVTLCRVSSPDGVNWSPVEELISLKQNLILGEAVVSPAIIFDENQGYSMWFVDSENHYSQRQIRYTVSSDGYNWSSPVICALIGVPVNPWHIDAVRIDNKLFLTVYDYHNVSLWESNLLDPVKFSYAKTILKPAHNRFGSFYSNGLYRSCLVRTDRGLEMFVSGDNSRQTFIGRMICQDPESLNFDFAGPAGRHSNMANFLNETYYGYKRKISFILRNKLTNLVKRS